MFLVGPNDMFYIVLPNFRPYVRLLMSATFFITLGTSKYLLINMVSYCLRNYVTNYRLNNAFFTEKTNHKHTIDEKKIGDIKLFFLTLEYDGKNICSGLYVYRRDPEKTGDTKKRLSIPGSNW